MLKNKFGKKMIASVMAAAMTVSATAVGMSSITALASNEELGSGTFNDGVGLPWHICESATGTMKFEIANGCYNILIENPGGISNQGEGRWDCQFRHRGLTIDITHKYRLTYSVWSNKRGRFYAKLGDMTNDDAENWHNNGKKLNLSYSDVEGVDQETLEQKLKAAQPNGQEVPYGEGWNSWKNDYLEANTWTTYAWEFEVDGSDDHMMQSDGTGELTFHLGGTSDFNDFICFEAGTLLKFDNLCLIDLTNDKSNYIDEAAYDPTGVEVNQVGYYPLLAKKATLVMDGPDTTAKTWELKNSSGTTVLSGTTTGGGELCDASGTYNQVIDFSEYQETGTGFTITCDGKTSLPFDIGNDIYDGLTTNAMNYFYQNRSGEDILASYITSTGANSSTSDLAREGGHMQDKATVQSKWVHIIPKAENIESGEVIDVTGGWYDAGDHGKYVVNGGVSMWTLLNLYESDLRDGDADKWSDDSGTVKIPENGNGVPDILDEVAIEADFFTKMQRSDGMVYHKIHDYKWTALCVAPKDDELERIVKPVTYAATLNYAAAMAQYARLVDGFSGAKVDAATALSTAKKAYDAASASYKPFANDWGTNQLADLQSLYAPIQQNKGGGPYGDTQVDDEFYWAACELYISTGDSKYRSEMDKWGKDNGKDYLFNVDTALYGGENNGTASAFTWGTLNSLGTLSLLVNADDMLSKGLLTADEVDTIKKNTKQAADYFVDLGESSDFGVPYVGHDYEASVWSVADYEAGNGDNGVVKKNLVNGYEWGSNSIIMNNTILMALAYDIDHEVKYINGVSTAMDYIMGRNLLEQSYVSGYGEHALQYPHHRWWSGQLNANDFPYAPDGVLSGGPNSEMQDPMVQGKGYKAGEIAPMACYLDNVEAWSTNECTINWNSPLVYVVSFLEDEAPNANGTTESKPTTTTTTTTSTTNTSDSSSTTTTTSGTGTTTTKTTGDDPDGLIGDVNLDGKVDLLDAIALNKHLAGLLDLNEQATKNANCDQSDGTPTIADEDASALMQYVIQIIKSLPVK